MSKVKQTFFYILPILYVLVVCPSCADFRYQIIHNVQFYTRLDSVTDPTFDFSNVKTIAFFPYYWTSSGKANGISALLEKQIFFYAKKELEKRGYKIDYIDKEYLEELSNGNVFCSSCNHDLVLMLFYSQKRDSVNFAGGSSGRVGWNRKGGGGSYSSTEPYSVPYYNLYIKFNLFHGAAQEVWFGEILKGSSEPSLTKKAEGMVKKIFSKKFPK